jgi:hypothetical protein
MVPDWGWVMAQKHSVRYWGVLLGIVAALATFSVLIQAMIDRHARWSGLMRYRVFRACSSDSNGIVVSRIVRGDSHIAGLDVQRENANVGQRSHHPKCVEITWGNLSRRGEPASRELVCRNKRICQASDPCGVHAIQGHYLEAMGCNSSGSPRWPSRLRKTPMLPRELIVRDVRRLVERQFLESVNDRAKIEYAGSSESQKRAILKIFMRDKVGGSKQWPPLLLEIL